uniref:helix-turn-helix domain-containing protein n=1 Tax=Prevotella heparinolytica TaxID=28113 RepID=UPI0035A147C7
MIFADKIIMLRKKHNMSQEQLAEKLDVSRQSISKWEGAQSIPDTNKIIQLAQIFGVSIDYLLRDDIEEKDYIAEPFIESETSVRQVSMEEANEFLKFNEQTAQRKAF